MKKSMLLLGGVALLLSCNNPSNEMANTEEKSVDSTVAEEPTKKEPSLTLAWETDTVLTTNESVLYDEGENILYVSNIAGKPTDKDGVGFISKLGTDGSIKKLKWVTGLDAPKGMGIMNGKLYVTNVDELVEINISDARISKRYPVEGAQFLNDVTISDNKVYFSDMNTGKLHVLENGEVSTLKEGLKSINGLANNNSEDQLYMLTGKGLQRMGGDASVETVNETVTGGDGLVILDDETYLASRWKGEIWLIRNGEATKLLDSSGDEIQTADIGYIPAENLVLVPRFFSNKVTAFKLDY